MRATEAAKIPIERYLLAEGYKHSRIGFNGGELWYQSPLRTGDDTPSFKVNRGKNLWYDHGLDEGGDVIKLVCILRKVTVAEALSIIESLERQGLPRVDNEAAKNFQNTNNKTKASLASDYLSSQTKILKVQDISHPALLNYLKQRHLDQDVANSYLKEVHYQHFGSAQNYFTLGWPNGEGFDTRNAYFKGFVGTGKTISTINVEGNENVLIFEGFIDFLSYVSYRNHLPKDEGVLILHSTALRRQAVTYLQNRKIKSVKLYLDHDEAGDACRELFKKALLGQDIDLKDCSDMYAGFKDFNEWFVAYKKGHLL